MKTGYPSIDKNHEKGKFYIGNYPRIHDKITNNSLYNTVKMMNLFNTKGTIETLELTVKINEFFKHADVLSRSLSELGVKKEDKVVICTPNLIQPLAAFFAANSMGTGVTFINPKCNQIEISKRINLFEAKVFIGYNLSKEAIEYLKKECPSLEAIINLPVDNRTILYNKEFISEHIGYNAAMTYNDFVCLADYYRGKVVRSSKGENEALYLNTSGTTGEPKIPIHTNAEIIAASLSMSAGTRIPVKNNGKSMVTVSFDHSYGLITSTIMSMMARKSILIATDINSRNLSEYMKRKPTNIFATPAFYYALRRNKEVDKMDLSFLKMAVSGGAPFPVADKFETGDFFRSHGANIDPSDGSGFGESIIATVSANQRYEPDTVGITLPGIILTTIDPVTHEELKYGEKGGVLAISGKNLSKGYYKDPVNTEKHFFIDKHGRRMFNSNTNGLIREDGYVEMYGKAERAFVTLDEDGIYQKCDTVVTESFVASLAEVFQCALVPRKDIDRGNVGILYVVLEKGYDASDELKEQILAKCKQKITVQRNGNSIEKELKLYQVPSDIIFVEELPVNKVSKIDYPLLEKLANEPTVQRVKK